MQSPVSERRLLKLVSSDGDEFTIEKEAACMSNFIKDLSEECEGSDDPIPLSHVKTAILGKIIQYCEHHYLNPPKYIVRPLKSSNLAEVVSAWDLEFLEMEHETLFELMSSANYLAIEPLLDLTCAKVASMMKGKTAEEIRILFDIVNDFTPEEEMQVREENKWCEDTP